MLLKQLPKYLPRLLDQETTTILIQIPDGHQFHVHKSFKALVDGLFILDEVWGKEDYRPSFPLGPIHTVLDLGAYLGDFAVWVCSRYHPQKVVALEPSRMMYDLMVANIALNRCQDVIIPQWGAIYREKSKLRLRGPTPALHYVEEQEGGEIQGFSLAEIIEQHQLSRIDFFKMDIEGGERHVLTAENERWFKGHVHYAFVEAHDLHGHHKEEALRYFQQLGFEVRYRKIPWFFGIYRIEALNPAL